MSGQQTASVVALSTILRIHCVEKCHIGGPHHAQTLGNAGHIPADIKRERQCLSLLYAGFMSEYYFFQSVFPSVKRILFMFRGYAVLTVAGAGKPNLPGMAQPDT